MLKINLLPEGTRKAASSPIEQIHRTPLPWVMLGLLAICTVIVWLPIAVRAHQLRVIQKQQAVLAPRRAAVDRLRQQIADLEWQLTTFEKISQTSGLWSRRLNVLSDVTPEGVWYSELSVDESRGLMIQGSVIGRGGQEMVGVGRLVQDLKADPSFSSACQDIQIDSIRRVLDEELEVVKFTLSCQPPEASSPS